MNNVHEDAPVVFQTRWTMSYLRGPLSRPQIAALMAPLKAAMPPPAAAPAPAAAPVARRARQRLPPPAAAAAAVSAAATPPASPSGIAPAYLPLRGAAPAGASLAYVPMLIGGARVRLLDTKTQVDEAIENARLAAFADGPVPIDWSSAADRRGRGRGSRVDAARRGRLPRAAARPRARPRPTRAGRRTTRTGSTRRRP